MIDISAPTTRILTIAFTLCRMIPKTPKTISSQGFSWSTQLALLPKRREFWLLLGVVPLTILAIWWLRVPFAAMLAHMGGSTVWVFSTTLLQLHTDDRFRGRVFSADLGFSMLTIAAGAFLCGRLLDAGVAARTVATWTGLVMLIPAGLWALAMRPGK